MTSAINNTIVNQRDIVEIQPKPARRVPQRSQSPAFERIDSLEQLQQLENQLKDSNYREQLVSIERITFKIAPVYNEAPLFLIKTGEKNVKHMWCRWQTKWYQLQLHISGSFFYEAFYDTMFLGGW